MRRAPSAIIAAHTFDRDRRTLVVEGVRDRVFVNFLLSGVRSELVVVQPVDTVDLPDPQQGGNRARVLDLLKQVEESGETVNIRGLIDRDNSTFTGDVVPSNCWSTDLRDAEGYVLGESNLEVALRLGCGIERVGSTYVLQEMRRACRFLAAIRLLSDTTGPVLAVSDFPLAAKHGVFASNGSVQLNEPKILSTIMQNSNVGLSDFAAVESAVAANRATLAGYPDELVVQGKDAFKVLTLQLRHMGCKDVGNAAVLLWSTFRREHLSDFPTLEEVVKFLSDES